MATVEAARRPRVSSRGLTPKDPALYYTMVWRFDVGPMAAILTAAFASGEWTMDELSANSGVPPRRIWGIINRDTERVTLEIVDSLLCAMERHIGEVYPDEYYRTISPAVRSKAPRQINPILPKVDSHAA